MKTKASFSNPILEGPITRQILFFFFPILFGTFFQQLYNTADMIIVGRFVGTDALASVGGSAAQIINLVIGFFTGLSAGSGVIIAQAYGAGDKKGCPIIYIQPMPMPLSAVSCLRSSGFFLPHHP